MPSPLPPRLYRHLPLLRELSLALLTTLKLSACMHLIGTHVISINGTLGPSMMPTLSVLGDCVLVAKRYRRGRGVRVGDVVQIKHPVPEFRGHGAVKRIVGMEGDFVLRGVPPGSARRDEDEGREGEEQRMIQVNTFSSHKFGFSALGELTSSLSVPWV